MKEKFTADVLKKLQRLGRFWVDLSEPTQDELRLISKELGIHPLVIEDIYSPSTRPKVEQYDGYLFMVSFAIVRENSYIHLREVNYILGKNYIITAHRKPLKGMRAFKQKQDLIASKMAKGHDYLMHHLIDMQVDSYFPVLETIEDEMDVIENKAINTVALDVVRKVFHIKRQLLVIRKVVSPFRDIIAMLSKTNVPNISKGAEVYFRDVYDHLIRISDMIDSNREIISTILEVHLSATSNRLNEIMKILTVFSTILLPLTFIASLYGMNFRNMPEIYHPYGYFVTLAVMGLIAVGMLGWFKHKKWI